MIANYHTHTARCNHAVGEDEEYVRSALEGGLKLLGFSDHTPLHFPGTYYSHSRMRPHLMPDYVESVRSLQRKYAGQIQIPLGVEAEYYPGLWQDMLAMLRHHGVEYMLLGQHWNGDEEGYAPNKRPSDDIDRLKQYVHQVCTAMDTGLFSYFAHPDYIQFTGDIGVYRQHMRTICQVAKQTNTPLEINLNGLHAKQHYPTPLFWELAAEQGCSVVIGSDAHDPMQVVNSDYEATAMDLVDRFGLHLLPTIELRSI